MSFLIGVLIGGAIVYFLLQRKIQEAQDIEQTLRRQLADSESKVRNLSSQVEKGPEPQDKQASMEQAELQAKTQELRQMTEKLSAAETQISNLREQLAAAESKAEMAKASTVAEESEKKPSPVQSDDLTRIEGIGPKVSQVLNDSGILTFTQLAATEASKLREILQEAGPRFKAMEPASWPEQAELAAKGAWNDLAKLQAELDGGKYRR